MKKNRRETGHQSSFFYRCSLCAAGGMLMGVAAVLFLAGGNGADSMNTLRSEERRVGKECKA